ncbi:alcohol-forming fatty acyl-CoA reductase-like isoform X2 [Papaver somniferum]|uniref:alcohol-forming fatty acyl-CoA reductase-like isoform X2 n=1 Tax=Papaver somniferum TaxID=3469 RepID=UPI000E6F5B18|nr:alcohol-forming fatty acyl-CoA reductase-like isoform X2 [Papaver somniferum]
MELYNLLRTRSSLSLVLLGISRNVIGKEVFRVLRKKHGLGFNSFISKKVTPIFGDVSLENMGMEDSDLEKKLHKEINFVVHFAATTTLQERYDVALAVNTLGAKHVSNFAEKCENLEMFLHVSTAFVCIREMPGVKLETPISQTFKETSKFLDIIEEEKKLVQQKLNELKAEQVSKKQETTAMIKLGIERANTYGWPNTYLFTKALGEITIGRHLKKNLPVVILRPTAVTGTYREPFPGWIEGFKSLDPLVISVGRGKLPCFIGDHESSLDIIPGDMVVNAIIVIMVNHAKTNNHGIRHDHNDIIYHIGNSSTQSTSVVKLLDYAYDYFRENLWMGGDTNENVKPVFFRTMCRFREHILSNYVVPMEEQKVQFAKRWAKIYEPYLLFKVIFDTSATDQLRRWMKAHYGTGEADGFDFDAKHINWKDYMINIHIPGLMKYAVKPHLVSNSKL